MNVTRICDFLRPTITDTGLAAYYKSVQPARSMEPDPSDLDADLPMLRVHPWREAVQANRYDNFLQQRADEQFAVVTVCPIEDLEALRNLLDSALLGKVLPTYTHDIVAVSGEVLNVTATVIWWRDIYQTSRERRQT